MAQKTWNIKHRHSWKKYRLLWSEFSTNKKLYERPEINMDKNKAKQQQHPPPQKKKKKKRGGDSKLNILSYHHHRYCYYN